LVSEFKKEGVQSTRLSSPLTKTGVKYGNCFYISKYFILYFYKYLFGGMKNVYLLSGMKSKRSVGRPRIPRKEPVKNTTVQVEPSVIEKCRVKHKSLANALRFAAKAKV
jgi:hypothetical protein